MYLVDSHCHLNMLDLDALDSSLDSCIDLAKENGVGHFLCVSVDLGTFDDVLNIAKKYPNVSASVGVHPNEELSDLEPSCEKLVELANHEKIVAIGETGLDYFRSEGDLNWQRDRFRTHIAASINTDKPLIIHTRQAKEDTLNIMQEDNSKDATGVMHCFTEDYEMAKACLDLGYYISFSGIVTFKNATTLQDVAKKVPLDRILVETDSPYLAPIPYRGKTNQPAYVKNVAEFISNLRGIDIAELADITTNNFFSLFKAARR